MTSVIRPELLEILACPCPAHAAVEVYKEDRHMF